MRYFTWPADHSPRNGARYSSWTSPEPEAQTTSFIYEDVCDKTERFGKIQGILHLNLATPVENGS